MYMPNGILPRAMFNEIKKKFYKLVSRVPCSNFVTEKFVLWINMRSSVDNKLHGSGRNAVS